MPNCGEDCIQNCAKISFGAYPECTVDKSPLVEILVVIVRNDCPIYAFFFVFPFYFAL